MFRTNGAFAKRSPQTTKGYATPNFKVLHGQFGGPNFKPTKTLLDALRNLGDRHTSTPKPCDADV